MVPLAQSHTVQRSPQLVMPLILIEIGMGVASPPVRRVRLWKLDCLVLIVAGV